LSSLANGESIEDILKEYPNISKEDVYAAIAFGSRLSDFESSSYDVKVS